MPCPVLSTMAYRGDASSLTICQSMLSARPLQQRVGKREQFFAHACRFLRLAVDWHHSRKHLPVVTLERVVAARTAFPSVLAGLPLRAQR